MALPLPRQQDNSLHQPTGHNCQNRTVSTGTLDATNLGYLTSPPEGYGRGPTATRPQLLQLSSLGPKDFERLCFRMTRLDATVEQCRFYGVQGQAQKGIDLYARRHDGAYMVVQCKRSSDAFTPGEVTEAVDAFLAGDWAYVRARSSWRLRRTWKGPRQRIASNRNDPSLRNGESRSWSGTRQRSAPS